MYYLLILNTFFAHAASQLSSTRRGRLGAVATLLTAPHRHPLPRNRNQQPPAAPGESHSKLDKLWQRRIISGRQRRDVREWGNQISDYFRTCITVKNPSNLATNEPGSGMQDSALADPRLCKVWSRRAANHVVCTCMGAAGSFRDTKLSHGGKKNQTKSMQHSWNNKRWIKIKR